MRVYDRETGASAYDPDGKAAPQAKRPRAASGTGASWIVAYITVMFGMLAAVGYAHSNRIDALEHRIDYDRELEEERFSSHETLIHDLAVDAIKTSQMLARAIKAYHPGAPAQPICGHEYEHDNRRCQLDPEHDGWHSEKNRGWFNFETVKACGELGREIEEGKTYYFDAQGKQWLIVLEEIQ